ncbi:MAG: tRNA (pseudouridine(54)-N(1))-methyltransferase TrmY [Candidatus Bathyarchaeota archaeon]|nr:tRNA (pseudouridine(54)-N(1))-methyltransferase TrmY [Candidatus Bathyarchaeota archaeon]
MREFILYSRKGRTDPRISSLHDAGRLDIVHECIVASLFLSHGLRRNVVFHACLSGPPNPPVHLIVDGETLSDVRTDQETWRKIIVEALSQRPHPGVSAEKTSFEELIKAKSEKAEIYVLEEGGEDLFQINFGGNPVFVLGDHVGLPRKAENFALRYGKKISLGKQPYLAASCITIVNYFLDRKETSCQTDII